MTDQEQVRRDEWIEVEGDKHKVEPTRRYFAEVRASLKNGQDALNDLQRRYDTLLAELEQAENEMTLAQHKQEQAEALLEAVPALVEAANNLFEMHAECACTFCESLREALAAYEQAQEQR